MSGLVLWLFLGTQRPQHMNQQAQATCWMVTDIWPSYPSNHKSPIRHMGEAFDSQLPAVLGEPSPNQQESHPAEPSPSAQLIQVMS